MKKIIILSLLLAALPSLSHGSQPLDVLKGAIDEVISILEDPGLQSTAQEELQQKKIGDILGRVFDFREISRRALARYWKTFTPKQQMEFSDVFGNFLTRNYLNKIRKGFKGEKVIYLKQDMVSSKKALVKTKVTGESLEIPVDYSMLVRRDTWRVYDVKIESVSSMKNYRAQFNRILIKESPSRLIERLRKNIDDQVKDLSLRKCLATRISRMYIIYPGIGHVP